MGAEPEPIAGTTWKPAYITIIEYIPPQVARQAQPVTRHQQLQEPVLPPDTGQEDQERKAAVEDGIAVAANAKEGNIQVRKDSANVTRHEHQEKDAQRSPVVCLSPND